MKRLYNLKEVVIILFALACISWPQLSEELRAQTYGNYSLPDTGQTKCYDTSGTEIACAGTGQDGDKRAGVDWPSPRFTVSGDCVTDNLTGLMWTKNANWPDGTKTWQGAINYQII